MQIKRPSAVKILTAANKYLIVQFFFDPAIQTSSYPVIESVVGSTTKKLKSLI